MLLNIFADIASKGGKSKIMEKAKHFIDMIMIIDRDPFVMRIPCKI